jgi:uncharacterized membrane protein
MSSGPFPFARHKASLLLDQCRTNNVLLLPIIIALILRLYGIDKESLRLDEIGQVLYAQSALGQTILSSAKHVSSTPLDYIITHLALRFFGSSDGILRLPSVLWGVLSVIVVYKLGEDLFDKPTGFLAAFLLAIAPLHVAQSRDIRFWSLATFLVLLSVYTFYRAVRKPTRGKWLLFAIVHLLALYAHYYALVVTLIQGAWLLWAVYSRRCSRSTLIAFGLVAGLTVALFMPWIYYDNFYLVSHGGLSGFTIESKRILDLSGFLKQISANSSRLLTGPVLYFNQPPSYSHPLAQWWIGFIWFMGALSIPLVFIVAERMRESLLLTFLLTFIGLFFILGLMRVLGYGLQYRHITIFLPFLFLTSSAVYFTLIRMMLQRWQPAGSREANANWAAIALLISAIIALQPNLTKLYRDQQITDYRETARYLLRHVDAADTIVSNDPRFVSYYAPELAQQVQYLPSRDWSPDRLSKYTGDKIWFVPLFADAKNAMKAWIEDPGQPHNLVEVEEDPLSGLAIDLYLFSKTIEWQDLLVYAYAKEPVQTFEKLVGKNAIEEALELAVYMVDGDVLNTSAKTKIALRAGRLFSDRGQHHQAIGILEQVALLNPTNAEIWANLGYVCSRQKGSTEEAILAFETAIDLDPNKFWPNHLLATILSSRGQWQDVIALEHQAIQSTSDENLQVRSLKLLAQAYSRLSNTPEACEALHRAYAILRSQEVLEEIAALGCTDEP